MVDKELLKRWRLILGEEVNEEISQFCDGGIKLTEEELIMDEALNAIYGNQFGGTEKTWGGPSSKKGSKQGKGFPNIAKWLSDIRQYFKEDVVSIIQNDAIERKGLKQLLFEPEVLNNIQPSIELVGTIMSCNRMIPEKAKNTAREIVKMVVEEIKKRIANNIIQSVTGALNKRKYTPIPDIRSIDWKRTINKNLKNYQKSLNKIIPERFYFYSRATTSSKWSIIVDMDQSGSMAESIVYGSIMGSILSSISTINTRVVAFDTEVVDLTENYGNDPVDMIFGVQLGGGTDINKSVSYCEKYISNPSKTIFILISDLFEGGNSVSLIKRLENLKMSGVKVICLLALSDKGKPSYDENLARKISTFDIPCFACTPNLLPELLENALKGKNLNVFTKKS